MIKSKFYIGIDPGTKTGIAVYEKETKSLIDVRTMFIHQAMKMVKDLSDQYPVLVRVEDPRQATMGRQNDAMKAQGAGSVKRDASIWEDFLKDHNIPFQMVRPNKRLTKIDSSKFLQITKYTGRTSNHSRDAAMLVYGW